MEEISSGLLKGILVWFPLTKHGMELPTLQLMLLLAWSPPPVCTVACLWLLLRDPITEFMMVVLIYCYDRNRWLHAGFIASSPMAKPLASWKFCIMPLMKLTVERKQSSWKWEFGGYFLGCDFNLVREWPVPSEPWDFFKDTNIFTAWFSLCSIT